MMRGWESSGRGPAAVPRVSLRWLGAVRAREWLHFLALPLAGAELTGGAASALAAARGVAIAALVLSFGYLLNAAADVLTDRPGKNPLRPEDVPEAWWGAFLLGAAAMGLAAGAPPAVSAATALGLVSGTVYSVGPRVKRVPVVGTLTNVTSFAPLLWVGTGSGFPARLPVLTALFACLLVQNQLLHEASDRPEDEAAGACTTLRRVGPRGSAAMASTLGLALAASAAASAGFWTSAALALVFALVFPGALAARGADPAVMARWRRAHRACAIAAGALLFLEVRGPS